MSRLKQSKQELSADEKLKEYQESSGTDDWSDMVPERTIDFCEEVGGLWSASLDGHVGKGRTMTEALGALCATLEATE